ncbi:hypothetical protein [Streptomyces venezuelae]|uniref:hypothetical protein n=1 Tax=Streptomyces venezuelae TaxID=54571 RepID=UPI003668C366
MRAPTTAALTVTAALLAGTVAAAGPANATESPRQAADGVSVRAEMPQSTTSKAKVKNGSQKVYSANIGYNRESWDECKPHASTMEKVVWNLGKVTRKSARIKSIKVRYYNERELHVGSAYLDDGYKHERWRKANGWYIPKGVEEWRTYKINKTVKFSKNKPLHFMLHVQLAGANEPTWCHPKAKLWFYLKPNR